MVHKFNTYMKSILLFLFLFAFSEEALAQWSNLLDVPTYGFCVNPKNPDNIYVGGLGRKLYRTDNGGKSWDTLVVEFESGSSRFTNVLVPDEDTSVVIVAGLGFGTVRRSSDRGETWQIVIETLSPYFAPGELIYEVPGKSNTLIASELVSRIIYQSTNNGLQWDSIGKVIPESKFFLCTLTPRLDSTNIIYGGCTPGTIVRSTDGGKSWIEQAKLIENKYNDSEVPKIVISKKNPAVMYAVVTYFYPESSPNGGVFKSENYGYTWKRIAYQDTSLWAIDVRTHNDSDELWVGGLFDGFAGDSLIPGRGIIANSKNDGEIWELEKNIPWFSEHAQNVWMLRYHKDKNDKDIVYYATQEGFLKYEYETSVTFDDFSHLYNSIDIVFQNHQLTLKTDNSLSFDDCSLIIYDMVANKVASFNSEDLTSSINLKSLYGFHIAILYDKMGVPIYIKPFIAE